MSTSSFIPVVSGSWSMRARSAPVMQPATAMVMPAEHEAVTHPASAPVASAIACEALRCRSLISTNSVRIFSTISTASGTTIEAPSDGMVPETLMMRRRPRAGRISGRFEITIEFLALDGLVLAAAAVKAREERPQALMTRIFQYLSGLALGDD